MGNQPDNSVTKAVIINAFGSKQSKPITSEGLILHEKYLITSPYNLIDTKNQSYMSRIQIINPKESKSQLPKGIKAQLKIKNISNLPFQYGKNKQIMVAIDLRIQTAQLITILDLNLLPKQEKQKAQQRMQISQSSMSSSSQSKLIIKSQISLSSVNQNQSSNISQEDKIYFLNLKEQLQEINKFTQLSHQNIQAFSKVKVPSFQQNFSWDNHLNPTHFEILGTSITKTSFYWRQITSQQPLQRATITSLIFQLHYVKHDVGISIGIVTQTKKPSVNSDGDQTISYYTSESNSSGAIYIDGVQVQQISNDLFIADGCQLQMQINLINFVICFNNKKRIVTHALKADHWKNKQIYVCVWMNKKGASVKLI